jgi:hypothetical protein
VDGAIAPGAVEHQVGELALEVGLHAQELEAQHLRVDRDGMGAVEAGVESLIN